MPADPNDPPRSAGSDVAEEALDERLPEAEPAAVDSTVGTGSFFAVGCVLLTVAVVVLGIIIFLLR